MALNKNALIRYKTIDKCLQNNMRDWTLEDLIDACSDALYDLAGKDVNVSKRTIQLDLQHMRGDALGYNAPIEVYEKKYYRYSDPDYSITNIPLTENDMSVLSETMDMLKQFQDFSLFDEFKGVFQKLEDKIYTQRHHKAAVIHLDKNANLKGLELLDELYQAILKEVVLDLMYQSFKAHAPSMIKFHPQLLKEYNNRWFIVGMRDENDKILTLALDRILGVDYDFKSRYKSAHLDADAYYEHTIGVTVLSNRELQDVVFRVDRDNAPYVVTKPFHHSQKILEEHDDGSVTFQIHAHLNYELERLLLGFGESLEVIGPKRLRRRMRSKFKKALQSYE
ncbi:transcriptional regulator [Nonlabens sp. YIK11]|uniref:helix-turn-helix transcriptional regulator n=1 Tax=Nonlabens sp. YIK11 TaxID=1453349 RepID=UPI0006DC21E0|nr:WYL domain-containing protein [Nonlabens sp. YIK11]KQC33033.1 transcriptional regulator [Nonlabens sp. YIK11]